MILTNRFVQKLHFKGIVRLGLIAEVHTSGFEQIDLELGALFKSATLDELKSFELAPYMRGSMQQRERIVRVAEYCARRQPGDFLEIGCYVGETTKILAEIARKYHRRVIAVDPWEPGTQNCVGWEYNAFLQKVEPYADIVDIVRASSLNRETIALIKERALCFAFIDGLHTYSACLSDIQTVAHCQGIIVVDDILWNDEVMFAFRRGAYLTHRFAIHHPLCREGYLVPYNQRTQAILSTEYLDEKIHER